MTDWKKYYDTDLSSEIKFKIEGLFERDIVVRRDFNMDSQLYEYVIKELRNEAST